MSRRRAEGEAEWAEPSGQARAPAEASARQSALRSGQRSEKEQLTAWERLSVERWGLTPSWGSRRPRSEPQSAVWVRADQQPLLS